MQKNYFLNGGIGGIYGDKLSTHEINQVVRLPLCFDQLSKMEKP